MKRLLCFMTVFFAFRTLKAQWVVQLAAYDKPVDAKTMFAGFNNVRYLKDKYDFHRYYLAGYPTQQDAEAVASSAKAKGFKAHAFNIEEDPGCNYVCEVPVPRAATLEKLRRLQNLFFGFDSAALRGDAIGDLNTLAEVLTDEPDFTCEFMAHTDSKGSDAYNENLSRRRAESSRSYLIRKGIAAHRIKVSNYGESQPIAKNELAGGQDTEQGRQFNRRVEIKVFNENGTQVNGLVEEINVPDHLRF